VNIFSELYIKHLARTLFFISIGVSSSIGQHLLTKNILRDEFVATVVAVVWASLLIMIYSYFRAEREHEHNEMKESFNYHRTLRADNRINAIDTEAPRKSDISKIEVVHSMEPMAADSKKPSFLKDEVKK
jgi:hypothetical protein